MSRNVRYFLGKVFLVVFLSGYVLVLTLAMSSIGYISLKIGMLV